MGVRITVRFDDVGLPPRGPSAFPAAVSQGLLDSMTQASSAPSATNARSSVAGPTMRCTMAPGVARPDDFHGT